MRDRKIISMMFALFLSSILIVGCTVSSNMSLTFNVETGDAIEIELDSSDGLKLKEVDGHFAVVDGDQKVLEGSFLTEQMYEGWKGMKDEEGVAVLEEFEKDGNPCFMLEVNKDGRILDFIVMWIDGSDTAVVVQGYLEPEMTKNVFDMLAFSKE